MTAVDSANIVNQRNTLDAILKL